MGQARESRWRKKTKVVIALENVSNNLWVMPEIFRHFVQSFQSPWVEGVYDIAITCASLRREMDSSR
jgi:hypothetical protein